MRTGTKLATGAEQRISTLSSRVKELRQTIRISAIEGMFAQSYSAIAVPGSIFLTKFAVMLGATPFHFGIFAAIGQLSQLFQPIGVALTRRLTTRKPMILKLVIIGRWLPLLFGLLPFLMPARAALWSFLALLFISSSVLAVAGNLWIAWISDMIPLRLRGRFFSRRNQYLTIAGLLTGYFFSAFIDLFDPQAGNLFSFIRKQFSDVGLFSSSHLPYALGITFAFSVIMGMCSAKILARQPERPKSVEDDGVLRLLLDPFHDANFRRLVLYGIWWMLAIGIGAPFWGPFMIQKLHMSLVQIQIYGTVSAIASVAALRPWGNFIDRYGNKRAMRLALVLGGLNPMVWVFAGPRFYWFVYFEAFTSGIMWAGTNIVAVNFVLAIAPKDKSQIYSGVFGAIGGLAMVITMLLSGTFLPHAQDAFGFHFEPEQVLFAVAGFVRWTTQIPLSWIDEPRSRPLPSLRTYLRDSVLAWRGAWK